MAVNVGSLLINLGLDSGEFKSGLNQAEKEFRRSTRRIEAIGKNMARTGRNLSLAITAPITALGIASFKAASDVAELQSAFDQTFGAMSKDMTKWAEATGDAMGRSTQEIQNAANTFGIFFNQAAPTRTAAADLSKSFSVLAQDLSSFFNVDPTVAMEKLRSGLSGESEPLRQFGVFLNEGAVKAKAFQMGIAKVGTELTDQNKIMARAALIMEATTAAQGDVARTSDGTANRIRAAKAAFEELQVAIGQKLIPAITPLIEKITSLLNGFNNLSPGVQKAIVIISGLAAAIGPIAFIIGNLVSVMAPMLVAFKSYFLVAKAATLATGSLVPALAGLRAILVSLTLSMAPWLVALGLVAGAIYLVVKASDKAAQASATYRDQQEKLEKVQDKVKTVTEQLATATGAARKEALANAHAVREETKQYIENAKAAVAAARAKLLTVRAQNLSDLQTSARNVRGAGGGADSIITQGRANRQRDKQARDEIMRREVQLAEFRKKLFEVERIINAPAPTISPPPAGKKDKKTKGPTGPTAAEIEARFNDELIGYAQQTLSAMRQTAMSTEERAEFDMRSVEIARKQALNAIDADEDYSKAQKDRLKAAVEDLAFEERAAIEMQKQMEIEREISDLLDIEFDAKRDMLSLDKDMADTQAERKRLALDLLRLEQEYRRNTLESVIASKTASDAEKARAKAILASLAAIETRETASVNRANETELESWLRNANMSSAQMGEAVTGIGLDGLDRLTDGISRAISEIETLGGAFNAMRDIFVNVIRDMIASLIKLQLQKALAGLLSSFGSFGGITSGSTERLSGASNSLIDANPGIFANGTRSAPGGLAWVGERGRELINLPRGSKVFPHGQSEIMARGAQGGVSNSFVWNITTPDANSFGRSGRQLQNEARRRLGSV